MQEKIEFTGKIEIFEQEGGYAEDGLLINKQSLADMVKKFFEQLDGENITREFGGFKPSYKSKSVYKITIEKLD